MLNHQNNDAMNNDEIWEALNKVSMDLLDPYRAFDELNQAEPTYAFADCFYASEENLDEFDWTGIKFERDGNFDQGINIIDSINQDISLNWPDFCQYIEASIANGYLWEADPTEYSLIPGINIVPNRMPGSSRREAKQDSGKLLRQLDRLAINPVDIFSPDDRILEAGYKVVSSFEMNVPLKIYSEDEEFVIKADLPDIVFNNTSAEGFFPEQLNFRSVLALLPDRINTRQLQPTFVDGQFRLELPKREDQKSKKIK